MSSTTPNLRLVLTGTSEEDKNILFETWRSQMNGEDGASNMQIIDSAIMADRERITLLEQNAGSVKSVNDKTGEVILSAGDVGARPDDWTPSISDIEGLQDAIDQGGNVKAVNSILPDESGNILISANDVNALYINKDEASTGSPVPVNANTLAGISADQYALKSDIPDMPDIPVGMPEGGTTGQILAKVSNTDYDAKWIDYTPPEETVDADTFEGQTLAQIKTEIKNDILVGSDIDADTLGGMTFNDIKTAILASVVYQ